MTPDLICCGKGISSGMPMSAVIGRRGDNGHVSGRLDRLDPSGQPGVCGGCAGEQRVIVEEGLTEFARAEWARSSCRSCGGSAGGSPQRIGGEHGKGLVASVHMSSRAGSSPTPTLAGEMVRRCVEKGLLLSRRSGYRQRLDEVRAAAGDPGRSRCGKGSPCSKRP